MADVSGRPGSGSTLDEDERFDAESARRILQHAVKEQHRLDTAHRDAYTRAELEEMAAETGISPRALSAAIDAERSAPRPATPIGDGRPAGWVRWLERRLPASWSPPFKRALLVSTGAVAIFWILISLPVIGPVVFWAAVVVLAVLTLLLLLGVSFV